MVIALIGGSGSGKSTAVKAAKNCGYKVIDADKIGHNVILKGNDAYNKTVNFFGKDFLNPDGEINRKKLGKAVFSDNEKLKALNEITHPEITKQIISQLAKNTVIDGAVIHKTPVIDMCDKVIFIKTDIEKRIKFITSRDKITKDMAINRIKSQPSDNEYEEISDIIIHNDGDEEKLFNKAKRIFEELILK